MEIRCSLVSFRVVVLLILLTPAATILSVEARQPDESTSYVPEIRAMLRDYIDTDKIGAALVLGVVDAQGNRVVTYGKLDNGTDREVDNETVFEIGSVTKVFTALLLQDMVERGEMELDDPVQKYLPASVKAPKYQDKEITLLHLATHTSGLPPAPDNLSAPTWRAPDPQDVYTVEQLYSFLSSYQLTRAPGMKEEYSNLGMQLLGHLIATKAGKSYEELIRERICGPLGMEDTRVTLPPQLRSRLAIGHSMPGARVPNMDFVLPGAGGLRSTANDMMKFVSAYAGVSKTPLNSLMQKAMEFHAVESGGKLMLAWGSNNDFLGHVGGTYGYKAIISFDPRRRHGIVVLSSCRNSAIEAWTGPLWDGLVPKPTNAVPLNPEIGEEYAGQYQLKGHEGCFARRDGTRFLLQWVGASGQRFPSYEIFPQSESVFRNEFWGVQATFSAANGKQPVKLVLTSLGPYSGFKEPLTLGKVGTRVPAAPDLVRLDSKGYSLHVGRYRKGLLFGLFHVGPTLSIFQEHDELGDHLVARVKGVPGYTEGEFIPANETSFVVNPMNTAEDIKLTFLQNTKGRTKAVRVYWSGRKVTGSRISEEPAL